jgi:hypothetical protein
MLEVDHKMKAQVPSEPSDPDKKSTIGSAMKVDTAKKAAFERLPDEIIQQ